MIERLVKTYSHEAELGISMFSLNLSGTKKADLITKDDVEKMKAEIKERMVQQFKASNKGFTENKIDGKGKIKLAKYFVYIEVYDFSVGEDEVVETSGVTIKQVTQLGLQVRFVDAETGEIITGSGQGRAITTKTSTTLGDIEGPTFNKSTVGVSTKKALETSTVRVVEKLIKKGMLKS